MSNLQSLAYSVLVCTLCASDAFAAHRSVLDHSRQMLQDATSDTNDFGDLAEDVSVFEQVIRACLDAPILVQHA